MTFKIPKKIWLECLGEEVVKTIRLSAIVVGVSLVIFLVLEQFKVGLISNTINISYFAAVELILVISMLVFSHRFKRRMPRKRWLFFGVSLSLLAGIMSLILISEVNLNSVLMAAVATVITYIVWYSYVYEN